MAAPAFGFSAGDFINAINLIVDISKALKSVGGARDDYQSLITELSLLQGVLLHLQSRQSCSNTEGVFAPYAQQQAKLTLSTLSKFLILVSKFDSTLGPGGSDRWYRHVGKKTQWAVVHAKDIDGLRVRVGNQLHVLNTILQLDDRFGSSSAQILACFEEIKCQNESVLQRLSSLDDKASSHVLVKIARSPRLAGASDLAQLSAGLSRRRLAQGAGAITEFETNAPGTGREDKALLLLLRLLYATARDLRYLLLGIWAFFPRFMTLTHEISFRLGRQPLLVVSESINFEDMLGRRYTLQHAYYSHWPTFDAFLRRTFRNFPGEDLVIGGHYSLLSSRSRSSLPGAHPAKWDSFSTPGCEISMSVRVKLARVEGLGGRNLDDCPWIECDGKSLTNMGRNSFRCWKCNLTYLFQTNDKNTHYIKMFPRFLQTEAPTGKLRLGMLAQADVFRRSNRTKRILRWEWICCGCGRKGRDMGMLTVDCPGRACSHARCADCQVHQVRRRRGATTIEYGRDMKASTRI
ncbi:hypothetical protein B0T16DRAFT_171051 [Cercophora newfieldiana]|uniref:Ubiquitin-like domain-containing protein n=1 Tax=Cercophora newfieldiana TaxID=92897 RepID=A0AA39Y7Q3_9PEZI|nr:hypothetical protein B0T16DRAFT_171051 [Cercophora newfieldiana]